MRRIIYILAALLFAFHTVAAQVGQWNAYLAYHDITDIEPAGNMVYVLSSNDLFSYNVNDHSIATYNKMNMLSDTEIKYIAWSKNAKRLLIVYTNYNIDLLDNNGNVINISGYYKSHMNSNKDINYIYNYEHYCFLCTAFGIIKLNMKNAEISETYNLGTNVNLCTVAGGYLYAQTAKGQYKGSLKDNLIDPQNWSTSADAVSYHNDNQIQTDNSQGYARYDVYDDANKCYWSSQKDGKLMGYTQAEDGSQTVIAADICPEGPKYNMFNHIKHLYGTLYTCGGNDQLAAVQTLDSNGWTIFEDESIPAKIGIPYMKLHTLDVDPTNHQHVFVGGRSGLFEFNNGLLTQFYNSNNSLIESYNGDDMYYQLVYGVKFDSQGNLWFINSQAPTQSLLYIPAGGEMVSKCKSELMILNDPSTPRYSNKSLGELTSMIIDHNGYLWFSNDNWFTPSLFRYDMQTEEIISFLSFTNQDGTNLPVVYGVRCVCEDMEGNLWIGTDIGPFMLEPSQVTAADPYFTQVKVPRNDGTNYADYLLSNVDILCMAVDGANRKWFGTNGNGVYVISDDNISQVYHFTTENSHLLSDEILSIAINNESGEVFFGTGKGLCSFQSEVTSSAEEMTKENVYAYPNPVRPDYTGPITIVGLTYNADVKITTSNGVLVAEGRSSGGSFSWDGCDRNGRRVASGVYMVHTATQDGKRGTVCKIAIVN
ncbi:MAG: Por secretion system protein [Prevotella sp.]|nr:Por secretion system protein [Prevotella sp.]